MARKKSWSEIGGQRIRIMRRLERQIAAQKGVRTRAKTNAQVEKAVERRQQLERRLETVNETAQKYMGNIYQGSKKFDWDTASKRYSRSRYMYGRVTG